MSRTRIAMTIAVVALAVVGIWHFFFRIVVVNPHPSGSKIIAFGDSLTSGVGAGAGEDYPTVLSQMINQPIVNRGAPGETTGDALRRLDRDVLNDDPKIVILFLGGNDLLNRLPLEETFGNLDKMITRIQDRGALVVLVGVQGLFFSDQYGKEFRKLAKRRGTVLVANILSGIITDIKLKSDQVHPNGRGYRLIAERIHAKLRPYL